MKKKIILISIIIVLAALWVGIIYKLSDMNTTKSNGKSTDIISLFIEDTLEVTNEYGITNSHPSENKLDKASRLLNAPLRKVMHASVYFVLAFLIILVLNILFDNKRYILSFVLTIVLTIILAGFDEFHQTFVAGRTGQLKDVIIDNIGAVIGCFFYGTYYLAYRIGKRSGKKEVLEEYEIIEDE